jgi:hypothetical protein
MSMMDIASELTSMGSPREPWVAGSTAASVPVGAVIDANADWIKTGRRSSTISLSTLRSRRGIALLNASVTALSTDLSTIPATIIS